MLGKYLALTVSLAALTFAVPVYAQTGTNSGTPKPGATDQIKPSPAPMAAPSGAAPTVAPAPAPSGTTGQGATDTDSGTMKQDDTDKKLGTQR
jgi:hypothetical protein